MTNRVEGNIRIGVAGLGDMGYPMALRMLKAGHDVLGHDIRPGCDFPDLGERFFADPGVFASSVDVLFTVVRDAAQTDALLFGSQALLTRPDAPRLLVVSSTLSPRYVRSLIDRVPAGTDIVDAPMSGAPIAAQEGTLTFMLGGRAETITRLRPLFEAMGNRFHHLGDTGAGMSCKVLNNFVCAATVAAVRRVGLLAPEMGIAPEKLREVMSTSSGGTWFGTNFDRIKFSREGYDPSNTMGIIRKDVAAYLDAVGGVDGGDLQDFELAVAAAMETLPAEPLK